jgi:PAS domain S-box-containing protein
MVTCPVTYLLSFLSAKKIYATKSLFLKITDLGESMPNRLNGEFAGTGIYSILKLVPVGIIILESPSGRITYANDRAIALYGKNPIGHSTKIMRLLKPNGEIYPFKKLPANRALKGEKIIDDEAIIERRDGSRILVSSTSAPLVDSKGEIIGSVAIFEDITDKRKLENKLDLQMKDLEKLVSKQVQQLKNAERLSAIGQTAGMIGHDIRNPLQAIFGDTYMLKSAVDSLPESVAKKSLRESIDNLEENLSYIDKIIQDLQDYAKPPKPTLEHVTVEKIIQEVISNMDIPDTIQVSMSLEDGSLALKADRVYLKRILTNLISNAIQALTTGGKISIKVKCKEDKALLSVEDTGHGIPVEVKDRIFMPLVTTKAKGQGFGLAVVKKLTEALNGNVTFESEPGKGTRFDIELPLSQK